MGTDFTASEFTESEEERIVKIVRREVEVALREQQVRLAESLKERMTR